MIERWFSKLGLENRDAPALSTIVLHVIGQRLPAVCDQLAVTSCTCYSGRSNIYGDLDELYFNFTISNLCGICSMFILLYFFIANC